MQDGRLLERHEEARQWYPAYASGSIWTLGVEVLRLNVKYFPSVFFFEEIEGETWLLKE